MIVFWLIITFMFLANAGWWLWADRRLRPLPLARLWRVLLGLFIGLQLGYLAFFFVAPSIARRAHYVVPPEALGVFYLWCLIVLPVTAVLTLLAKTPRGFAAILGAMGWRTRVPAATSETATGGGVPHPTVEARDAEPALGDPKPRPALTRRQLLAAAAVAVPPLVVGTGVIYGRHSIYDLRVRKLDVVIPGLPKDLDGLTIAHLTDIHVGKFVDQRYLNHVRDVTNALHADVHLLTGDLIDLTISDLPGALDFVNSLDPKHGLAMCEGNHDLIEDGRAFYAGTRAKGVPLLLDGWRPLRIPGRPTALQLLGVKWGGPASSAPGDDGFDRAVAAINAQKSPDAFSILLAHHPHAFDVAAAAGVPLTLAGHTHGGLLMLSERVGPAAMMYRYWGGLYNKGNSRLFVSNGVGSWYPVRVNAQPEVAHLTLRCV